MIDDRGQAVRRSRASSPGTAPKRKKTSVTRVQPVGDDGTGKEDDEKEWVWHAEGIEGSRERDRVRERGKRKKEEKKIVSGGGGDERVEQSRAKQSTAETG